MRRPLVFVGLAVLAGAVLAATVFREQVAYAAQAVEANIVGPLDGQGNVKVHEQGTANVNVTNSRLTVAPQAVTKNFQLTFGAAPSFTNVVSLPEPIDASLISFTRMRGIGFAMATDATNHVVLRYRTDGGNIVLPLTQPVTVSKVAVECNAGTADTCSVEFNVLGG